MTPFDRQRARIHKRSIEHLAQIRDRRAAEERQRTYAASSDPLFLHARLGGSAPTDPLAHATLHTCIRLIAQTAGSIPWKVMQGNDEASVEVVDSSDAWYRLFSKPNSWMTRRELKELTITQMLTSGTGESFWFCLNAQGQPVAQDEVPTLIIPKSGDQVTEWVVGNQLVGWRTDELMGRPGECVPLCSVVQITDLRDPKRSWRGISRLRAAQLAIDNDLKQQAWSASFYENGASPGGQIVSPEGVSLTPDQAESARKQWDAKHAGSNKAGKTAVLPWGLKWAEVASPSHREQDYAETLRLDRDTIAALYGVPAFFFSAGDATFNSSRNQRRALIETTVLPLCSKIEDAVEQALIEPRTDASNIARKDFVWLEFDPHTGPIAGVMQDDFESKVVSATKLWNLGYTQSEVNARLDLGMQDDESELADVRFLPSGLVLADDVLDPPEPVAPVVVAPPPAGSAPTTSLVPPAPPADPKAEPTLNPDNGKDGPQRSIEVVPAPEVVRAAPNHSLRREMHWRSFEKKTLAPQEKGFRSKVSRYLNERRSEVLRFLGEQRTMRADGESIDMWLNQARARWDEELAKLMTPAYEAAAKSGIESITSDLGGLKTMGALNPKIVEFVAAKALRVTTVNATLLDSLRSDLVGAAASNATVAELQESVRRNFGLSRSNALRIARTEAASSVNGARQMAMESEGVQKTEWISSRDQFVRDSHDIDGEIQPLGTPFSNGCAYPGDGNAPASETCNCRCVSSPVSD